MSKRYLLDNDQTKDQTRFFLGFDNMFSPEHWTVKNPNKDRANAEFNNNILTIKNQSISGENPINIQLCLDVTAPIECDGLISFEWNLDFSKSRSPYYTQFKVDYLDTNLILFNRIDSNNSGRANFLLHRNSNGTLQLALNNYDIESGEVILRVSNWQYVNQVTYLDFISNYNPVSNRLNYRVFTKDFKDIKGFKTVFNSNDDRLVFIPEESIALPSSTIISRENNIVKIENNTEISLTDDTALAELVFNYQPIVFTGTIEMNGQKIGKNSKRFARPVNLNISCEVETENYYYQNYYFTVPESNTDMEIKINLNPFEPDSILLFYASSFNPELPCENLLEGTTSHCLSRVVNSGNYILVVTTNVPRENLEYRLTITCDRQISVTESQNSLVVFDPFKSFIMGKSGYTIVSIDNSLAPVMII